MLDPLCLSRIILGRIIWAALSEPHHLSRII
jgi:hypothetical protein